MRHGGRPLRAAALVVALAGCGPITYVGEVRRASDAVEAARAVHADKYALYWWTRATEYLHKARELAGHADFQAANRYGKLASEAANLAEQEATYGGKDLRRRQPGAPIAPAKDGEDKAVAPAKDTP